MNIVAMELDIISSANILERAMRAVAARPFCCVNRNELRDLMICTSYTLTVLRDTVELGTTEVDQALASSIRAINLLSLLVSDQLDGRWTEGPVDSL